MKKNKRYVSYFQSVITVGILNEAKNCRDAEEKAQKTIGQKDVLEDGFCHCSFSQTPFALVDSEEWIPEIEPAITADGLGWKFCPSEKTREKIAKKLKKLPEDLTEEDLGNFIKNSVEKFLK
jgi:hypothetical protein